eukprot:4002504-Lingulodinium_polyedra.AAC.1
MVESTTSLRSILNNYKTTRSNRPSAAATRQKLARARAWNAQTCDARTVAAADGRFDRIIAQ